MSTIKLPEVNIPVPEIVVKVLELSQECFGDVNTWLVETGPLWYEQLRRVAFPLLFAGILFWPILLSLFMAFTAAGTWIFWLFTSLAFGIIQLIFVIYQFFMIFTDIVGLSILKTYSVLRSRLFLVMGLSGKTSRRGRRLEWRKRLEAAVTCEDFQKIPIDPHEPKAPKKQKAPLDHALSIRRNSFGDSTNPVDTFDHASHKFSRNHSYNELTTAKSEESVERFEADPVVVDELGEMTTVMLLTTKQRLKEARQLASRNESDLEAASALKHLLSGVVKRNHLALDNFLIQNARSIAATGQYGISLQSRKLIYAYYEEVEKGLHWLADAPLPNQSRPNNGDEEFEQSDEDLSFAARNTLHIERMRPGTTELNDRMSLVRKMKQNMGNTALMLSGGGAQAMYHLGTIKALVESNLYNDIKVISGTSGGSITAAMCAIKTPDELLTDVCVATVSTDYGKTGEQKKLNIRWFPTLMDMGKYWIKSSLMVDSALFRRTCEFYYADITFEEAFDRTGKHVCITVSASRASGDTAQRLLLNHISTPHVTLASAVAASCALPGVMAPAKLLAKNSSGVLVPFEVDGVEWIDGSVQADLPFQRISTLFNVSNFVVCQTNFHVLPFLNKAHHPDRQSLYWRLFQILEWDIRNRALQLSRLGLFPKIFGQDMSKIFKQKYHGNLTIVPRFTPAQTFGLKILSNPTVVDMVGYLKYGQIATWPCLSVIRDMIRLERAIDDCLSTLEQRYRELHPDIDWSVHDDIESIASIASSSLPASNATPNRVRFVGRVVGGSAERETEKMRTKMTSLEQENNELKVQLEMMQKMLMANNSSTPGTPKASGALGPTGSSEGNTALKDKEMNFANEKAASKISEGAVWNMVKRKFGRDS